MTAFDQVDAFMVNTERAEVAAVRLARFVREGGDLNELLGRLVVTAPRQIINAVTDMEDARPPVVTGGVS